MTKRIDVIQWAAVVGYDTQRLNGKPSSCHGEAYQGQENKPKKIVVSMYE